MIQDCAFWKSQITSAKQEHKSFWESAKKCNDSYSKERSYNIFYSNVNVLVASLFNTMPKPDIQRRFFKRLEGDKLKSSLYSEVAKISSGALEYYGDKADLFSVIEKTIENSVKLGRGVSWIEYEPTIEKDELGQDIVTDRKINLISLKPEEFLINSADSDRSIWWSARRHLLTREDLKSRFDYEAEDRELSFEPPNHISKQTEQKRGEVWEVWEKVGKKRLFILMSSFKNEFLEVVDDPYKLECFFPYKSIHWLDDGKSIVPKPEYTVYKKKAIEVDEISEKSAKIEEEVKYVVLMSASNKDTSKQIADSENGDVITIPEIAVDGAIGKYVGTVPVDAAMQLVDHLDNKIERLKADIYDITGISDIIRGVSDPRETAEAQKIKGQFGSLRFIRRQKVVQEHIRQLFRIIVEIICEHWDAETLAEITAVDLLDMMQKRQKLMQLSQDPQAEKEIEEIKATPTWEEVLQVMRSDKMRNYTVDVETTATAFDDKQEIGASINQLATTYVGMVQQAGALQDPNLIRGFIPIVRMALGNIRVSSAVATQLEDALDSAVKSFEEQKAQPPEPSIDDKRLEVEMAKISSNEKIEVAKLQLEQQKISYERDFDMAKVRDMLETQELKIRELEAQVYFKEKEMRQGENINPNISGQVANIY
jgi:hypothetical protein